MWTKLRALFEKDSFKARLSPSLRQSLRFVYRYVRTAVEYHRVQHLLVRNADLRNASKDRERCFIIGNGPSIKEQDLTRLRGETTFVVNSFYRHPDYDLIDPTYHCHADPIVGTDVPHVVAHLRDVERTAKRATIILPTDAEPMVRRHELFRNNRVHYVFFSEEGCERGRIRMDLTRTVSCVTNIVQGCILMAMYMGFRNIYLLGCDHDWLANPTVSTYFFGQDLHWRDDAIDYTYELHMENTLRLWRSYRHVRDFAFKRGIRIYNATRGGFLDVFPRIEYESLVSGRSPSPRVLSSADAEA